MVIGSTALKKHFSDLNRVPKDVDYINEGYQFPLTSIFHFKDKKIEKLDNPVLIEYYKGKGEIPPFIGKDELYTLKISHSFWNLENGSWRKHIWDINFMKNKGCKFIKPLFDDLFNYWSELHGPRKSSDLDMSAADFFNNAITFPVGHDRIHELLIEHPYFEGQSQPTYAMILKEGAEVDVCMDKFEKLTEKQKFNVTFEEVANMALERNFHSDYRVSYDRMLKKFITSHCKIEQGIWIIQNHRELLKIPFNYVEFLNNKIKEYGLQKS